MSRTKSFVVDILPSFQFSLLFLSFVVINGCWNMIFNNFSGQFIGICQLHDKEFRSETPKRKKKEAQQDAAKLGLLHVGISDPEKVRIFSIDPEYIKQKPSEQGWTG